MKLVKRLRLAIILILIIVNVGCDQITKTVVRKHIDYNETVEVLDDKLVLTKVENSGAFLSLGDDFYKPIKVILLLVLPLIALVGGLAYVLTKQVPNMLMIGLSFVIGGGIGNIFDRFAYGSVTDFMYIDIGIAHTGIFNMADVSVMIGMGLILLNSLYRNLQPGISQS